MQRKSAARFSGKDAIPNSPTMFTKPKTRIIAINLIYPAGPL